MQQRNTARLRAPLVVLLFLAWSMAACGGSSSGAPRIQAPPEGALDGGAAGSSYEVRLAAAGTPPFTWTVVAGALPAGLALEVDTGRIHGTPTAAGDFAFTVEVRNAQGSHRLELRIEIVGATPVAPTILTAALPDATVDLPYSRLLSAVGTGPLTWSVAEGVLPPGLALGATTGLLAGTPTTAATATFTVAVTNLVGTDSQELTLEVLAGPTAPTIQAPGEMVEGVAQMPPATRGSVYLGGFQASGTAPIAWSVVAGALPTGLQLDPVAGVLGGVPIEVVDAAFTVRATNAAGHDEVACRLVVAEAPPGGGVAPGRAPRGATVVVAGTGFTAGATQTHLVTIDGHVAHVIAASETELRVEVPAAADGEATIVLGGAAPGGEPVTLQVLATDVGFVDADATVGENDGTSWRNAYTGVDAALLGGHDELWIADGVYRPGSEARQSFTIATDQVLLGGFAGIEGATTQRDPTQNLSVLSGDWLGDDQQQGGSTADNSPHVVVVSGGSSVLDGLVIERGYAGELDGNGANLRVTNAVLALRDSIVRDGFCAAGDGAGMWASAAEVDVDRCWFLGNEARHGLDGGGHGGGIEFRDCVDSTCDRTVFEGNRADLGGGTYTNGAAVPIRGCVFVSNRAVYGGAAHGQGSNTLYHCTAVGNEAMMYGGGFSASGGVAGAIEVIGCVFANNFAFDHGNDIGVEVVGSASATIENTRLTGGIDGIYYWEPLGQFTNAGGVVAHDPDFVDDQSPRGVDDRWGTSDDGLVLGPQSQLIDLGGSGALATDLRGVARPQGQAFDIGAYESVVPD